MSSRTVYHTHIKYLAYTNLLPTAIIQQIPRSTLARWKKESPKRYKVFDINQLASADFEIIQHFAHSQSAKRVYSGYVRIIKTVISIAHSLPGFHHAIKSQSTRVVALIQRVREHIGFKRSLQFFNISVPTFRNWSVQSHTQCFESLTNSCNRVFHNQLSRPEINRIKEMVMTAKFQYWPISSIALHALRNNILPLSINTWYKYVNKLGLSRVNAASRRKKSAVSVRAHRPHEIWHADITQFITADNVKHYIYVVIDNFSRKILSWLITDSVKREYRSTTIEEAIAHTKTTYPQITLITDGGPENRLNAFLNTLNQPITHKIALVDVHYSNSLIEASFKTAKYNYLYRMDIRDETQLKNAFAFVVDDFNNRPHISLKGLTPNEAEQNHTLNKEPLHNYIKQATDVRLEYNKNHRCAPCKA